MSVLREIVTKFGFLIDEAKITKLNGLIYQAKTNIQSLTNHTNLAKKAFYGLVATVTGLTLLSVHTAKAARSVDQLADKLGLTSTELQTIELAAQSTGLGVNELSDSMNAFHKKLGDIGQGSTDASREMMRLGIVFTGNNGKIKSSFQLYKELAQKIDSIKSPIAKAAALQRVLGTDNIELAKLFRDGGAAIRAQSEEIEKISYIIDSKGIKSSKEFLKSWSNFQIIIGSVKKEISVKFMPVFNRMMKAFKDWFGENRKLISQSISSFINILSIALGVLFKAFQLIIAPINIVITLFGSLENALRVFGTALLVIYTRRIWDAVLATKAWTIALLANPVTWITIAVGALTVAIGLLVDDLWGWSQDNNSVIGYVLKEWLGFEGSFKDIVDSVTGYFKQKFEDLSDWFSGNFETILNTISKAKSFITGVHNHAVNHAQTVAPKVKSNNFASFEQKLLNASQGFSDYIDRPIVLPTSNTSGIMASNPYNPGSKISQYITENVTVNVPSGTTAEQARAIATQVTEAMQMQISFNMLRGIDGMSNR